MNEQICTIFSMSAAPCDLVARLLLLLLYRDIVREREHWRFMSLCVCFLQSESQCLCMEPAMELDFVLFVSNMRVLNVECV